MRFFRSLRWPKPALIRDLDGIVLGTLDELAAAPIERYEACRGPASSEQIDRIFDLILDPLADEDQRDDAISDGLWDLLIHQYTLYSATPIALYRLLRRTSAEERATHRDLRRFVELCGNAGTGGIWLDPREIVENRRGKLPIFPSRRSSRRSVERPRRPLARRALDRVSRPAPYCRALRHVHSRFPVAVHVFLLRGESVLLMRRANTGFGDGMLSVVAGHVDADESVTAAARRETREEVAVELAASALRVVGVMHRRSSEGRVDFFLAAELGDHEPRNAEPAKCSELLWAPVTAPPADTIPYVRAALANFRKGRWFEEFGWKPGAP